MQKSKVQVQNLEIPQEVKNILEKLTQAGYGAYIVGGCVRDLLMGEKPQDWDVTTNARPEEIQKLFPDSFYENKFGTVGVHPVKSPVKSSETGSAKRLFHGGARPVKSSRKEFNGAEQFDGVKTESDDLTLQVVEVTTYRIESKYTDKRHPDEIKYADKLEDDLKRRDFTINALAMDIDGRITDLFDGQIDIKNKLVRAVGEPDERFNEDALRLMRAVRLAATLGFNIDTETTRAIKKSHGLMAAISKERIRDELVKIISSPDADKGMELLRETELMKYVLPEMLEGVGVTQNKHHIYTVWEHNLRALRYACDKNYSFEVRMASFLHDVGKPRSKRGEGTDSTFYAHEIIGARMTAQIMDRLRFPQKQAEKIIKLVRYHLFYYNVGEVSESSVRRLVANIGKKNVEDLIKVREADRIGSGVPKAKPYKLRHLQFMIDKVARDPISPKMLKVNGDDIMKLLGLKQSVKVGMIIHALMNEVLDDPDKNTEDYLKSRAKELNELSETELAEFSKRGKEKEAEEEQKEVSEIKKKYYVE